MTKKTIIYIGKFIFPDGNAAAQRVINNAKLFRYLGYNVHFICYSNPAQIDRVKKEKVDNFDVSLIGVSNKLDPNIFITPLLRHLANTVKRLGKQNVLAIIPYNYNVIGLIQIIRLCRSNQIKLISDITEWYQYHPRLSGRGYLYSIFKNTDSFIRMRLLNFMSNGIIAISSYLYEYYNAKVYSIQLPPLVDLNHFKWPNQVVDNCEDLEITIMGTINHNKETILPALRVFAGLSDEYRFRLNIIGVDKNTIQSINNESKKYLEILDSKIKYHGRISHQECINILHDSNYFLLLRYNNLINRAGFSTKYVESISSGCPVITNEYSYLHSYIIEGKNGFIIDSENYQVFKRSIEMLLKIGRKELCAMKKFCLESKTFHYQYYEKSMKVFLESLFNTHND